ncbi:unnamed protein product [Ceratitis capitata]|uniref:(Mediterranean fruit fly) hypothetical protein n=1 Tax=Ceratitis capitata TaxID=7213 RepID=A0A811VHI9_CERCA|nr:unnamed protein product [Ceratitis capitata]
MALTMVVNAKPKKLLTMQVAQENEEKEAEIKKVAIWRCGVAAAAAAAAKHSGCWGMTTLLPLAIANAADVAVLVLRRPIICAFKATSRINTKYQIWLILQMLLLLLPLLVVAVSWPVVWRKILPWPQMQLVGRQLMG